MPYSVFGGNYNEVGQSKIRKVGFRPQEVAFNYILCPDSQAHMGGILAKSITITI